MSALRSVTAAIALLLLWSSVSGAQTTAAAPIKIGWIGHLTGVLSAYGQDMLRAAEMAVEDVNASGGALGRKLELVVRDDRGDPSQAATLVRELDTQEHVLVLSGSMSADVSKALRGYAELNQLPYISASSGDASLTAPGTKWTQRVQPPAAVQGAAMAKFALAQKPDAKIAVLRHDILYFPEVMNGAIWYLETVHGKVVYNQYFPPRQADFNVVAAQLKEAAPDYILFAFNPPGLENSFARFRDRLQTGADHLLYGANGSGAKSAGKRHHRNLRCDFLRRVASTVPPGSRQAVRSVFCRSRLLSRVYCWQRIWSGADDQRRDQGERVS